MGAASMLLLLQVFTIGFVYGWGVSGNQLIDAALIYATGITAMLTVATLMRRR